MGPAQNCTIHPQHLLPSPSSGGGEAEGGGAKWSARARCRRRWRFAGGSIGSARTTPVYGRSGSRAGSFSRYDPLGQEGKREESSAI
uniref:Uncharacterized protein n=1 Tax=Oryza nivara TaxID=4536 RepID=A0A0E0G354_ORYNI